MFVKRIFSFRFICHSKSSCFVLFFLTFFVIISEPLRITLGQLINIGVQYIEKRHLAIQWTFKDHIGATNIHWGAIDRKKTYCNTVSNTKFVSKQSTHIWLISQTLLNTKSGIPHVWNERTKQIVCYIFKEKFSTINNQKHFTFSQFGNTYEYSPQMTASVNWFMTNVNLLRM